MLVSQYIYTACGKDRNGAFSVFSKSKDITDAESSEIREVMMYKTPAGLPYEPTEHEIEEKFPKKFGYFFLSSGRACLAQVCYVGRVYSDLDTRWGNYIIHAFVFEKNNDFSPYSFIEHNLFKRILTKKEWHDNPIPDELPKIEIPENGGVLSAGEITGFFNEERKNKLKLFIDAVINSSSENIISFNDDQNNHKYWLKMLSLCLPKEIQNKISFCSHFTNTIIPGNISSHIQIRINRSESAQFNYAQEAQKGRYAFDLLRNIIPVSVVPGKYVESIVNLLSSGVFDVVKFVDNIDKIMSAYSVSINEASDLFNINKADYSNFENADEIFNTILIADRVGFETHSIANNLWTKKPQPNFNVQQRLSVLTFIYKNISAINTRVEIIKTVIGEAKQLEIRMDGAIAFRDDLKSKVNFIFTNYLDYLKAEGLVNYIKQNEKSFEILFIVFDFLIGLPAVINSFQARNINSSEETIACKNIMGLTFKQQSMQNIDLLINSANSRIGNLGIELLSVTVQDAIKSGINFTNMQSAFDVLQRLRPKNDFAYSYLLYLIKVFSRQDEFIKAYINAQDNTPDFFTKFESQNKQESLIKDFCMKKDAFRFVNQQLTLKVLKEYFDKYYVIGADTGLFIKRLDEYLSTFQPNKKIIECMNILDIIKLPIGADEMLLPPAYRVVLEVIFSVPYEIIFDHLYGKQEWFDRINDIYSTIKKAGVSLKQETRELILITLCGRVLKKYGFKENNQQILSFFSKTQVDADNLSAGFEIINSSKSVNTFIDYYFPLVANILILGATAAKQFDYDDIFKKAFGKIIENGDLEKLVDDFIDAIRNSKPNPIAFILHIFRKRLAPSPNSLDKKLGDIAEKCFEKLPSGERKKIFSELLAKAEQAEAAQFESYFEKFNKEHKSGLFDFFKKKN